MSERTAPQSEPEQPPIRWTRERPHTYRSTSIVGAFGRISGHGKAYASIHDELNGQVLAHFSCNSFRSARLWCEDQLQQRQSLPKPRCHPQRFAPLADDWRFLQSLNGASLQLKGLAIELLTRVRKEFRGQLQYHPQSERWVESPDNFWTLRVQSEDRTLRITIRANSQRLAIPSDIRLTADRPSYVTFKIQRLSQVSSAFLLIQQSAHNRRNEYFY